MGARATRPGRHRRAVLSGEVRPGGSGGQGTRGTAPLTPEAGGSGSRGGFPPFEDFKESDPQAEPPAARGRGARSRHLLSASRSAAPAAGTGRVRRRGSRARGPSLRTRRPRAPTRLPAPRRSSRRWPGRGAAPRPGPAGPPSPRPPDVTSWKPSGPSASLTMAPPFRPEI